MNTNTDKDVLRRQERILCSAGNLCTQRRTRQFSQQHASILKRATGTRDSCEVSETYSCSNTDAYVRF